MTRETKIGLLVGLAFIIVIGILLSEHVSSTNEPQQAALSTAGSNVRDGVATPGATDGAPVTIAGAAVDAPRQPVPTHADLRAADPPVAFVQVGGPGRATPRPATPPAGNGAGESTAPASPPAAVDPETGATAGGTGSGALGSALTSTPASIAARNATRDLLQQHPGELVPVDPNGATPPASPTATPPATYTAVAGDSVSRIAGRLMGGNTKANRDLLIRANPSLQNDGYVVLAGRTYIIPKAGSRAAAAPEAPARVAATPAPRGPVAAEPTARSNEPTRWYTVKGDDNLWKIAQSQLGSGNAWTLIRDLNKDLLKGGETVHPNMRLRLPAKTAVAGAD